MPASSSSTSGRGPEQDHEALAADFQRQLESEVVIHSKRYLPKSTDPAHPIVRAALQAAGKAGPVGSATTSDWALLGDIPTVKVGPGDTFRSHSPNEYPDPPRTRSGRGLLRPARPRLLQAAGAQ